MRFGVGNGYNNYRSSRRQVDHGYNTVVLYCNADCIIFIALETLLGEFGMIKEFKNLKDLRNRITLDDDCRSTGGN